MRPSNIGFLSLITGFGLGAAAACQGSTPPGGVRAEPAISPIPRERFDPQLLAERQARWRRRRTAVMNTLRGADAEVLVASLRPLGGGAGDTELGVASLQPSGAEAYLSVSAEVDPNGGATRLYLGEQVAPCSSLVGHPLFGGARAPEDMRLLAIVETSGGRIETERRLDIPVDGQVTGRPLVIIDGADALCGVFFRYASAPAR